MDSSKDFLRCVYNFLRVSHPSSEDSDDTIVLTEGERLQVNGHEVGGLSGEETVAALRSATEPIVVHVMRRMQDQPQEAAINGGGGARLGVANGGVQYNPAEVCGASGMEASIIPDMVSVATQTDDVSEEELQWMLLQQQQEFAAYDTFWTNGHGNFMSQFSPNGLPPSVDLELADFDFANGLDYFDAGFDMEYEEVVLERASTEEKVGLTLCYENHGCEEDEITDIFVSEIEANSIAALDGRVKEGDQILQINETEVHSRQDAIKLFSETGADIRLLIARQILPVDERYLEEQVRYQYGNPAASQVTNAPSLQTKGDEQASATDTASTARGGGDKDSGVGRTDESAKNEESSEQDLVDCVSNHALPNPHGNDSFTSQSTEGAMSEDRLIREYDLFRQALEQRCVGGAPRQDDVSRLVANEKGALERADSQSSIERELAALNKEMEKIQIECQQIVDAHKKETAKCVSFDTSPQREDNRSSPNRVVPRMGTRLDYAKQLQLQQELSADPIWIPRDAVLSGPNHHQNGTNQSDKANIILPLQGKPTSNAPSQNGNVDKKDGQRKSPQPSQRESSCTSAYGTGESSRNTPLSLEIGPTGRQSLSHMQNGVNNTELSKDQDTDQTCSVSKSMSNSSVNQITQTPEPSGDTLQELYSQYADVMYTNQANLQHTIMLQQKLFQQKLSQNQQSKSQSPPNASQQREETLCTPIRKNNNRVGNHSNGMAPHSNGSPLRNQPHPIPTNPQIASSRCEAAPLSPYSSLRQMRQQSQSASAANSGGVQMEWVVKRRADGSRYITRRPMRSKMLKERARKISEERSGMTTDDDAMSELKVGRYWSKDERKRHLEKAREYKRRKQEMLRARMETVREHEEQKREQMNILELSQRKQMRHKSRKMYDDFTTVQEILAHGAHNSQAPSETSSQSGATPLLSVTTV